MTRVNSAEQNIVLFGWGYLGTMTARNENLALVADIITLLGCDQYCYHDSAIGAHRAANFH